MRYVALISTICLLGGCEAANQTADTVARESAKTVVNTVVQDRLPGVNAAPVTDCIIDNATRGEIFSLAKAAATGVGPDTIETVLDVAQRPQSVRCISQNTLGIAM